MSLASFDMIQRTIDLLQAWCYIIRRKRDEKMAEQKKDICAQKNRAKLNFREDGKIAVITIDNFQPVTLMNGLQQINTLDAKLFLEIDARLDEIEQKQETKAVVLTGINPEGFYPVFCDGIDLTFLSKLRFLDFGNDMKREVENHRTGIRVLNRISKMSQYFVARINGHCIGGGLELALGCDYLISLPKMLIGFPESKYGLLPGWNGIQSLAGKIGKEKALALYFEGFFEPSGKPIFRNGIVTSDEALSAGILDEVIPSSEEMDSRIKCVLGEFVSNQRLRRPKPELFSYKMMPE